MPSPIFSYKSETTFDIFKKANLDNLAKNFRTYILGGILIGPSLRQGAGPVLELQHLSGRSVARGGLGRNAGSRDRSLIGSPSEYFSGRV